MRPIEFPRPRQPATQKYMSDLTHEREILQALVESEGWQLFAKHAEREWGPSGLMYQAAVRIASEDASAVIELQKVLHTQTELIALMRWPAERLSQLKHQTAPSISSTSRRGPGL